MRALLFAILTIVAVAPFAFAADNVNYTSGGVGASERAEIQKQQKDYLLKLVFTGKNGRYLSEVQVVIKDKDGVEVLNALSEGPIFLANLAPGKYKAEATVEGVTETRDITIGKTLREYYFRFKVDQI